MKLYTIEANISSAQELYADAAFGLEVGKEASSITTLKLQNFRNYKELSLEVASNFVVLTGHNGAGKTNILEAISMLTPGRGLRGAKLSEMDRFDGTKYSPWTVFSRVSYGGEVSEVGTGRDPLSETEKRIAKINGSQESVTDGLAKALSCLWITPKLSQIFLEGMSERRKFFDRIVYNFDAGHAARVSSYETLVRERNRLLREYGQYKSWLSAIERQIAEKAVSIAAARVEVMNHVNSWLSDSYSYFPKALIEMEGEAEGFIRSNSALESEALLVSLLEGSRAADRESGRTSVGVHKSDILVFHHESGRPVELCSTGEQKALLISIILASCRAKESITGSSPLLLLDDIAAHLDEVRRKALFDEISALNTQAWITGTDYSLFHEVAEFEHYLVSNNQAEKV